ncbi:unnamed protein product, partial [Rodentolepis nana]|uniref:Uncharacterized protein n=1 Tax=Rodentolepis nana TaxID=102285 RepID=A0A0R3TQZ0_RODNA
MDAISSFTGIQENGSLYNLLQKKQKKKRRFKLPSFARKTRTKQKGGHEASHTEPG